MLIKLCFSGWLRNVKVTHVHDVKKDRIVDIRNLDPKKVLRKLQKGTYLLSLRHCFNNSGEQEVEIFEIEEEKVRRT